MAVFQVTKWWHVLIYKCESMMKLNYVEFIDYTLLIDRMNVLFQVGNKLGVLSLINVKVCEI